MSKKFLYILPFALSALFAAGFVFARELEVSYPAFDIGGVKIPGPSSTRMLLPDYVKYIFTFSIATAGLVAFGVIFFSGFQYFLAGGNPTKLSEAKNKIIQALIGVVILLGSYMLLTTINPELIIINPITAKGEGVILYDQPKCPGNITPERGTNFLKLGVSAGDLENVSQRVNSIWLYKSSSDLEVKLYPQKNWDGEAKIVDSATGGCVSSPLPQAKSVELVWKNPGVYLCTDATKNKCSVYNTDTPTIPKDFEDKVGYIYFKNPSVYDNSISRDDCLERRGIWFPSDNEGNPNPTCFYYTEQYGAVLHEGRDFSRTCDVFLGDDDCISDVKDNNGKCVPNPKEINIFPADGVSSITVFRQNNQPRPEESSVTLFEHIEYNTRENEKNGGKITFPRAQDMLDPDKKVYLYPDFGPIQYENRKDGPKSIDNDISSLEAAGNYMALLFNNENYGEKCEVFKAGRDPNLKSENYIGNDKVSSMIIIPVKQ